MARRVAGRPAPIGAVTPGNSTTSRSGGTGKVRRSLIYVLLLSTLQGKSQPKLLNRAPRCTHRATRSAAQTLPINSLRGHSVSGEALAPSILAGHARVSGFCCQNGPESGPPGAALAG